MLAKAISKYKNYNNIRYKYYDNVEYYKRGWLTYTKYVGHPLFLR